MTTTPEDRFYLSAVYAFYSGMTIWLCSFHTPSPYRNILQFIVQNVCCFACGALGHLYVVRQLRVAADTAGEDPEDHESSISSPVYTPRTDDSQSISEENLPEMSTEEKIATLQKEMKELQATEDEDAYERNLAAVQKDEADIIYSGMKYTDEGKANAKQDLDAARKKYWELALLRDKKRLRLERIKLDIAALRKERLEDRTDSDFSNQDINLKYSRNQSLQSIPSYSKNCDCVFMVMEPTTTKPKRFQQPFKAMSILLLFLNLFAILLPATISKKPLRDSLIMAGFFLPLHLALIIAGLDLFSVFGGNSGSWRATERMEEQKRHLNPAHLNHNTLLAELVGMIFSAYLAKAAVSPPSPSTITGKRETVAKDVQRNEADSTDDAPTTIFTPSESDNEHEVSSASIVEDIEYLRGQKKVLEAAEVDEEFDRQMARLDMEEAQLRYESTFEYSSCREARLRAWQDAGDDYKALKLAKKLKVLKLKRIDLKIEYLGRKRTEKTD